MILYENLTREMLYHPEIEVVYTITHYITLFFSTVFFCLTSYTILKKSKPEMYLYKYLILNQLFWSYLFNVYLTFWQPIVLFPFFFAYSAGLAQILGFKAAPWLCIFLIFLGGGMVHSLFTAFVYRVGQVYYQSKFHKWLIEPKKLLRWFLASLALWMGFVNSRVLWVHVF